ncbi:hypothetical protein LB467_03665 [Salegentibacter sp. JZCK2]|uniref:hypothetical protein n=1 Tax=Salegentibacter tibetensis TaxID=2873600 RepID=UPI001CCA8E5C|nr:hypothetical protein [Salegentibacter tibetensis]MBZ9728773.1 hypothetical protein [Salegentibacter tibetensis]
MKKRLPFILLFLLLFLAACQKEEYEVITEQDQNSISIDMEAYNLIYRAAMYDGSADDQIDNNPCFSLLFPYTITFQGSEINISSETERQNFLESLPANANPQDIVLDFPVTVINPGHQRITVRNRQQFAGLQQACRNMTNERGTPITCVNFSFPLRINSYNSVSQQANSAVLNSQEDLFVYFDNLTASSVVSFEFPLEISVNNILTPVNNGAALVSLIRQCEE